MLREAWELGKFFGIRGLGSADGLRPGDLTGGKRSGVAEVGLAVDWHAEPQKRLPQSFRVFHRFRVGDHTPQHASTAFAVPRT